MTVVVVATIFPLPDHRADVVALYEEAIGQRSRRGRGLRAVCPARGRGQPGDDREVDQCRGSAVPRARCGTGRHAPKLNGKLAGDSIVKVYTPRPAGSATQGAL